MTFLGFLAALLSLDTGTGGGPSRPGGGQTKPTRPDGPILD